MLYALVSGNKVVKGLDRYEAIRRKRYARQMIIPYKNENELDGLPFMKLKEHKKLLEQSEVYAGEWNFGKLSINQKFDLVKAYENKDYDIVENLIIKNGVMPQCGSCTYSQKDAMEWIKDALERGRL